MSLIETQMQSSDGLEQPVEVDYTFSLQQRPAEEQHLGIMGPLLRAAVGDTMEVGAWTTQHSTGRARLPSNACGLGCVLHQLASN